MMNLIGGVGLVILGFALFVNKVGEQSFGMVLATVAIYGFMTAVAFGTAHALSENATVKLSSLMLWLNWSLIGLYAIGAAAIVLGTFASPDVLKRMLAALLPGALVFVVPELINIRALMSVQATQAQKLQRPNL
jgi:hypothetical protein